jgi:hypothetical protein
MSYISVTTIVEGAVDDERDLPDDETLALYCAEQRRVAEADGLATEVFVVRHSHDIDLDEWGQTECACAQYAQDHRPVLAVNV